MIAKIQSLAELRQLAASDPRYVSLLLIASSNLGKTTSDPSIAYRWLETNAAETDEKGVVAEVNFCRDLVKP